jgi:hypothetical protein
MDNLQLSVSVLESHAAQLRAEAMAYLFEKGTEYTEALSEIIADIQNEDSEHKRILGTLAEIGYLAVFAGAAQTMETDE